MGRAHVTSHFSELEEGQRPLRWAPCPKAKFLFLVIEAGLIGTSPLLPAKLILLVTDISHLHLSQLQETCERSRKTARGRPTEVSWATAQPHIPTNASENVYQALQTAVV